jgi:hypothetical protein
MQLSSQSLILVKMAWISNVSKSLFFPPWGIHVVPRVTNYIHKYNPHSRIPDDGEVTEDLSLVQKKETFSSILCLWNVHLTKGKAYSVRDKPIFSPDRMLRKDYFLKASFEK